MLLKNKTAIITGCNRGIGNSILKLFAKEGADIIACIRNENELFLNSISCLEVEYGIKITPIYFDYENLNEVKNAIIKISNLKLKIDILVNNAGVASGSIFQMTQLSDLEKNMRINFFSTIYFSQSISRLMSKNSSGSIINITSISGILGGVGTLSYGSSKAALNFATKNMAIELGKFNIRVNAIAPSVTKTDMHNQMDKTAIDKLIDNSAFKRVAEPIEIANVALFLASDMSSYMTAQVLRVDGGLLI